MTGYPAKEKFTICLTLVVSSFYVDDLENGDCFD